MPPFREAGGPLLLPEPDGHQPRHWLARHTPVRWQWNGRLQLHDAAEDLLQGLRSSSRLCLADVLHRIVMRGSYGIYYGHGGGTSGGQTTLPSSNMELGYAASPNPTSRRSVSAGLLSQQQPVLHRRGPCQHGVRNQHHCAPPVFNASYATYYSTNAVSPYKVSSSLAYLDPYYGGRTPTFEGWSFGYQVLVTKDMTATISYVGNQGHFLVPTGSPRGYWSNQLDPKWLSLGTTVLGSAATTNMPAGTSLPYASFNGTASQGYTVARALTAFPQYSGLVDQLPAVGNSNYNALQIFVQQRFSHGFSFMLSYTYSKTIDDVGTFRTGYAIPSGVLATTTARPIRSTALSVRSARRINRRTWS